VQVTQEAKRRFKVAARRVRMCLLPVLRQYKGEGDPNEAPTRFNLRETVTQRSWSERPYLATTAYPRAIPMDLRDFAQFHLPALEADDAQSRIQCADRRHHGGCEGIAIGLLPLDTGAPGHWLSSPPGRAIVLAIWSEPNAKSWCKPFWLWDYPVS